jgi:hypothetical protein
MLCDLTTCFSFETAWFQRLILEYDKLVSKFAIKLNLRHYMTDGLEATMEIRKLADVVFSTVPIVAVGASEYFQLHPQFSIPLLCCKSSENLLQILPNPPAYTLIYQTAPVSD